MTHRRPQGENAQQDPHILIQHDVLNIEIKEKSVNQP